jgi:hypothetical protein
MCVEGKRVLESGNKGDFPLTRLLARMGEGGGRFPACTFTWARISMFARMSEREERERGGGGEGGTAHRLLVQSPSVVLCTSNWLLDKSTKKATVLTPLTLSFRFLC